MSCLISTADVASEHKNLTFRLIEFFQLKQSPIENAILGLKTLVSKMSNQHSMSKPDGNIFEKFLCIFYHDLLYLALAEVPHCIPEMGLDS